MRKRSWRDVGEGVRGRRWRKRIGGVGGRARSDGRRITSEEEEEEEKEWEKEQARTSYMGEGEPHLVRNRRGGGCRRRSNTGRGS